MWDGAIQSSTQSVTRALLHRSVLPENALPFEKVSGAISVRAALRHLVGEQSLLFAVPEAQGGPGGRTMGIQDTAVNPVLGPAEEAGAHCC